MIKDMQLDPRSRHEERPAIDMITIAVWTAMGLVLIVPALVMVSLG